MAKLRLATVCCLLTVAAACGGKESPEQHLARAKTLFADGKYRESTIEYRAALQIDPNLGLARLTLGDAYLKLNEPSPGLREYVRAADLLPQNLEAQLKAGNGLLAAGAFEEAKVRADKVLAVDPHNVDGQVLRGNALASLKDLDGALADYQEAIALDPTKALAYASMGGIQFGQGKRDEAEQTFRKAVEQAPQSVYAQLALANFLWATNRIGESEAVLKSALALEPQGAMANRALGMFYVASGRAPEAEPYFVTLAGSADTMAAHLALADYYLSLRRFDDARRAFAEVAGRDDGYAVATIRLAAVDTVEGRRAEAQQRLRELLVKEPTNGPALLLNARLLLASGKRDEALAGATAAVTNARSRGAAASAHELVGTIQSLNERLADAIAAYENVLKLDPRPFAADVALARLQLSKGDPDKAAQYAKDALALNPANPEAQSLLVRSDLMARKIDRAEADLAGLLKAYPSSSTVLNLSAQVALVRGHRDVAYAAYLKALKAAPNDVEALTGVVKLELLQKRSAEALARIDTRLADSKPSTELLLLAAQTYAATGKIDKVEAALLRAVELYPDRLQAYVLLGQLYIDQHRLSEADARFKKVLERDPKSVPAATMTALLLDMQGKAAEARPAYEQVLAIDPQAAVASNNLAWIYSTSPETLDKALPLALSAHQQMPDEPNVNDTLGWIYYQKEMANRAIPHLEASVRARPGDVRFQHHLGMAYMKAGDWPKARVALTRALALKGDYEGAEEAKKALAITGG